jgi:hypothetical protein
MTGERHYDFRLSPSLVEAQSLIPPERTTGRRLWKPAVLFEYGKEEGHWVGALIGATQNESAPHYHCVIDIFPVWRRTKIRSATDYKNIPPSTASAVPHWIQFSSYSNCHIYILYISSYIFILCDYHQHRSACILG